MFFKLPSITIRGILLGTLFHFSCCSPVPLFLGIPKDQYWGRASSVFHVRTRSWVEGKMEGSRCHLRGERCSLDLLCVGPQWWMQCHKPVKLHGRCDWLYKICDLGLSCFQSKCVPVKYVFLYYAKNPVIKKAQGSKIGSSVRQRNLKTAARYNEAEEAKDSISASSFAGVPAQEYWERASAVQNLRSKTWPSPDEEGLGCSLDGHKCSPDFLCVGPSDQKQCHKPVGKGGGCDGIYKICGDGLLCYYGICTSENISIQVARGIRGAFCVVFSLSKEKSNLACATLRFEWK